MSDLGSEQAPRTSLGPKLCKEFKPGTRNVSHEFDMGDWKPDKMGEIAGVKLLQGRFNPFEKTVDCYCRVIPARLTGTWAGTMTTPESRQEYREISGTVRIKGKDIAVSDARLSGDQLTFAILDDTGREPTAIRFDGRATGDTIQGLAEAGTLQRINDWGARRVSDPK